MSNIFYNSCITTNSIIQPLDLSIISGVYWFCRARKTRYINYLNVFQMSWQV